MKFRFTNAELLNKECSEYLTDKRMIQILISERIEELHPYSPLRIRLTELKQFVEGLED